MSIKHESAEKISLEEWNKKHKVEEGSARFYVGESNDLPRTHVKGSIFLATDTNQVFIDTGESWLDLTWQPLTERNQASGYAGLEFGVIPLSLIPTTLTGKSCAKDKEMFALIRPDGSGDYPTIQAALDAGVRHVWLEPGSTFVFSGTGPRIQFKYDYQQLHGNSATFKWSSPSGTLIDLNGKNYLVVENLIYDAQNVSSSHYFIGGSTNYSVINNIRTVNQGTGVMLLAPTCSYSLITNIYTASTGNYGLLLGANSNYNVFLNCYLTELVCNSSSYNSFINVELFGEYISWYENGQTLTGYKFVRVKANKPCSISNSSIELFAIGCSFNSWTFYQSTAKIYSIASTGLPSPSAGIKVYQQLMTPLTSNYDFNYLELERVVLYPLSADPDTSDWGSDQTGRLWFNTTEKKIKFWDGASIKTLQWNQVRVTQSGRNPESQTTENKVRILAIDDNGTIKYKPQHYVDPNWEDLWDDTYLESLPTVEADYT